MKRFLLNKLLKYLYNSISEDDILIFNDKKRTLTVAGRDMHTNFLSSLQSEVKTIKELDWWKFMVKDMKYVANKTIYENSKNIDDIIFGKAVLYTLDIMERKMNNFLKLK